MNNAFGNVQSLLVQITAFSPWLVSLYLRSRWQDASVFQDLAIVLLLNVYQSYTVHSHLIFHILGNVIAWFVLKRFFDRPSSAAKEGTESRTNASQLKPWTKPLILPCRTTHSRMFPKKHSFSYSYLFVGMPVGWSGCYGSLLSADASQKRGWFHVDPADFLARGDGHLGLRGKLDAYLESQDATPSDFPYAYLVTAPRFLGYSFNPVSFWYLYSAQKKLQAMILEVNNTFDERRMYFLTAASVVEEDKKQLQEAGKEEAVEDTEISRKIFTNQWKKDFHVSPFNSRDGSYKLIAHDPAPFDTSEALNVNNTIILRSSQGHKKLVARVFSTDQAVNPMNATTFSKATLIIRWGWVGFVTFPRILREAWRLYFKQSLEVFFRPEVSQGSISRHATDIEKDLESFFFEYLQHVMDNTPLSISLTYRPAAGTGTHSKVILRSPSARDQADVDCDFDVLSPAFYSRFVHYAHTSEALDREFLCTDAKNRTISITKPQSLAKLFAAKRQASNTALRQRISLPTRVRWQILQRSRCAAAEQAYPAAIEAERDANVIAKDIRRLPLSDLDTFVLHHSPQASVYRRQVTSLFLAQRFAFGFPGLVSLAEVLGKLCFVICIMLLFSDQDVATKKIYEQESDGFGHLFYTAIIASCALHLISLAKGSEMGYMVPG